MLLPDWMFVTPWTVGQGHQRQMWKTKIAKYLPTKKLLILHLLPLFLFQSGPKLGQGHGGGWSSVIASYPSLAISSLEGGAARISVWGPFSISFWCHWQLPSSENFGNIVPRDVFFVNTTERGGKNICIILGCKLCLFIFHYLFLKEETVDTFITKENGIGLILYIKSHLWICKKNFLRNSGVLWISPAW